MGLLDALGINTSGMPETADSLNARAAVYKDAPGLAMMYQNQAIPLQQQETASKQQLIKDMAGAIQKKDYQSALSMYSKLDPEGVKTLLPQIDKIDPGMAESLGYSREKGQTEGQLESQTKYGSNPAQLREMDMAKEKKQSEGRLTDKQDAFAQQMFKTVTASQDFKHLQEIRQRAQTIAEFSKNPSAFGDIANVFGFMKSIDPASVVRETEFATASEAGGLLTRAKNILSKAEKGERLTDAQRQDLVRISSHMQSVFDRNYKDYMKPVYKQAEKRGVPIDLIDPFFDAEPSTKIAPGAAASSSGQKAVQIQGTSIKAPVGAQVRIKSTDKIMTVQPDGSLK